MSQVMLQASKKLQSHCVYSNKKFLVFDSFVLLLISFGILFLEYFFNNFILQDFANSADEYAYLFQAQIFAQGDIYVPAHPKQEFFSPFYIHELQNRVFSIFPPGWPLILSVGVLAGVQEWVNPLIGALTVPAFFYLSWLLFGRIRAWISISLLCLSPFFLFNNASYFAHPSCLFFITICMIFLILWERQEKIVYALLCGFFFSWAFLIRELTSLAILFIPIVVVLWYSRHQSTYVLSFFLGCLPLGCWYIWYNVELTGVWFYPVRFLMPHESLGFGKRVIHVFDYVDEFYYGPGEALYFMIRNLGRLFIWTFPFLPVFAVWGIIKNPEYLWIRILGVACLSLPAAYLFYPSEGGNQYGPRFYYESLCFLCLLASGGIVSISSQMSHYVKKYLTVVMIVCLIIINGVITYYLASSYYRQIYWRRTLYQLVERRDLNNAVVFVGAPSGDMTQGDLIRNPPDISNSDVVYAWDLGERNSELRAAMPERSFYFFGYDQKNRSYHLRPLTFRLGDR